MGDEGARRTSRLDPKSVGGVAFTSRDVRMEPIRMVSATDVRRPSLGELTAASFKVGCLGFGGPAGQIALMHRVFVEEKKWIDEARYLHALNYCMLLPGPEAQQLATYVGWLL